MNSSEKRILGVGLVLVVLFSLFLAETTFGKHIDTILHDQITDTRLRDEVVIIGIDDASLQKIGAWPWERDIFAKALDILMKKGARLVVFDILFLENRDGDTEVKEILKTRKQPIVFATKLDANNRVIESVYATSPYAISGVAHVYPDNDGKVRRVTLSQKDSLGNCHKSLAYQAFSVYTKEISSDCDTTLKLFLFQDTHPKTLSFIDVLEGTVPDEAIKDKVIFVGSNSLDMEDHFISQHGEKIPGVYIHASIFTTLLNNSFLKPVQNYVYVVCILIFLAYILMVIVTLKNIFTQAGLITFGGVLLGAATVLVLSLHYWVSLSHLLFPYIFGSIFMIMFRYATTERKNSFIKKIFGQYVNPKVLATILKNNDLKLGGEKKYITILFSDIRGFTTMTEKMAPEKLVETLNTYLEAMSPIIMNHDGVIDKYIGDAIMAFWNAPVDVAHHEEKAVRASLVMIETLKKIQEGAPLEIGIGLHAGDAIVGNIGSSARINYTIIGDAVNACSRLEGLTKKYGLEILVSEQIKNAIHADDILWRSIDVVRVKGKSEIMKLYEPMKKTEENQRLILQSEEAFRAYFAGDFRKATTLYKEVKDRYSATMVSRMNDLQKMPSLSSHTVWDWDEK